MSKNNISWFIRNIQQKGLLVEDGKYWTLSNVSLVPHKSTKNVPQINQISVKFCQSFRDKCYYDLRFKLKCSKYATLIMLFHCLVLFKLLVNPFWNGSRAIPLLFDDWFQDKNFG